jgi:hypothetical protein
LCEQELFPFKASTDPDTTYYHQAMRKPYRDKFQEAKRKEYEDHFKESSYNLIPNLIKLGFIPSEFDECLFYYGKTIFIVYADGTILIGPYET